MKDRINRYTKSDRRHPFFILVGDAEYDRAKTTVGDLGYELVRLSDYCKGDSRPDFDRLHNDLRALQGRKVAIIGTGEYLALSGEEDASRFIGKYKDFNLGSGKAIFLLRGVGSSLKRLTSQDFRFKENGVYSCDDNCSHLKFKLISPDLDIETRGKQTIYAHWEELQKALENGEKPSADDYHHVKTRLSFQNASYNVKRLASAYDLITELQPAFSVPEECGTPEQWMKFYGEFQRVQGDWKAFLAQYELTSLSSQLSAKFLAEDYDSWRYFIALKSKTEPLNNASYLSFVVERSTTTKEFRENLLSAILDIESSPERAKATDKFWKIYEERKEILGKCFRESDLEGFVTDVLTSARSKDPTRIFTDLFARERRALTRHASERGMSQEMERVYPALAWYADDYSFKTKNYEKELTEYFRAYKSQKLANQLDEEFLKKVDEYAENRIYPSFPSLSEGVEKFHGENVYLYWLDSFGVEYLSLIAHFCEKHRLSLEVKITRASLPSTTSYNKHFYEEWQGAQKESDKELDEIKHNKSGKFNGDNAEYIADELDVLEKVLQTALNKLKGSHCQTFLLVGDHGASRLAVLRKKEEKYDAGTKGQSSGRYCPKNDAIDLTKELPFATEENDCFVLADYGRFRGSRAADIEVHGGASLEEVLVPVVAIRLLDSACKIFVVKETWRVANNTPLTIRFKSTMKLTKPIVKITAAPLKELVGKEYADAQTTDGKSFVLTLKDARKAGEYHIDIYDGENRLLRDEVLNVESAGMRKNSDFDDFD